MGVSRSDQSPSGQSGFVGHYQGSRDSVWLDGHQSLRSTLPLHYSEMRLAIGTSPERATQCVGHHKVRENTLAFLDGHIHRSLPFDYSRCVLFLGSESFEAAKACFLGIPSSRITPNPPVFYLGFPSSVIILPAPILRLPFQGLGREPTAGCSNLSNCSIPVFPFGLPSVLSH